MYNNKKQKIAVQLDLNTFRKIEEILEDHGLYKLMQEITDEELMDVEEAKVYYAKLPKKK